jgi:hypothetical protein
VNESSCFTSLPTFDSVSVVYFGHSNRCFVASHCLIHNSLKEHKIEHLFLCLLAISMALVVCVFCMFFFVTCLFCVLAVLGFEFRALRLLDRCSTTRVTL